MRPPLLPLACFAVCAACSATGEEEEAARPLPKRVPNVPLERPGFRLLHPETWRVATEDPAYDPDHFFFLEGPDGATVALMMLDEPADPAALVASMSENHGLADARTREFTSWGRFEGVGVDVHGLSEDDVPSGLRAFAWSSEKRSFLAAESYFEYGYAAARTGFDVIELSFTLIDPEGPQFPAVSLGTPAPEKGEMVLVRRDFELRFPDDWSIDHKAPDYDADRLFSLVSPYESCWIVLQILDGAASAEEALREAASGMRTVLSEVREENEFDTWGRLRGTGLELIGRESDLDATLRVFACNEGAQTLLVAEFWYAELAAGVDPGRRLVASSFEFR